MKEYHRSPVIGPGGLTCNCCNPFSMKGCSKRKAKTYLNRAHRRKAKVSLIKQANDAQ